MTSRLFSPIKNRGLEPYTLFQPHPYGDNERGTFLFIKSLNDMSYLDLSFPIPYQAPYFDTKPADFIGHIVGYGGPNSLSLHLQNKGWIVGLGISSTELARGTNIFGVQVSLTPEGLGKLVQSRVTHGYSFLSPQLNTRTSRLLSSNISASYRRRHCQRSCMTNISDSTKCISVSWRRMVQ